MTLHISMTMPSHTLKKSPIDQAVTALATQVAVERRNRRLPGGPSLDITFMLSSREAAPPFTGMRMGGYTREADTLFFETAVPVHIAQSDDAPLYVATVLEDVIDNASDFFRENAVAFDAQQWHRVLARFTGADRTPKPAH